MRELTNALPKPMIEVRGKPVLQHIVEGLRDAGVRRFLIIVGYYADAVRNFFGDGSRYKIDIQYETQVVQDGTGRVVELARSFSRSEPFVLSYGDILVDPANCKRVVNLPDNVEAILTVRRGEDVTKGGAVFVNQQMEVIGLQEKPRPGEPTSPWYNAGLYAFRSSILALLIIIAVVFYLLRWLYTVYLSVSMFSTTAFGATGSASKPHPQIFTPPWGLSQFVFTWIILGALIFVGIVILLLLYAGFFAEEKSERAALIVERLAFTLIGGIAGTLFGIHVAAA